MPYIDPRTREAVRPTSKFHAQHPGELNFQISTLCAEYLRRYGVSYAIVNEVIGALECAKMELYRRIAAPYEDTKIEQNGDVYDR